MQEEELKDRPLLVLANKQDIQGAMAVDEIQKDLNLVLFSSHMLQFTVTSYDQTPSR